MSDKKWTEKPFDANSGALTPEHFERIIALAYESSYHPCSKGHLIVPPSKKQKVVYCLNCSQELNVDEIKKIR